MERKDNICESKAPSLLEEVFAVTNGNGVNDSTATARAMQQLHARLASAEFATQMTGIFFEAKQAALAEVK